MAKKRVVRSGKAQFIREQFHKDNSANTRTINEAWKAAGHTDEISSSQVNQARSSLGLASKRETDKKTSGPKGKGKVSKEVLASLPSRNREDADATNKSAFVEEWLRRNPGANVAAVNRAWSEAGHEDSISDSVFYKIKRERVQPAESTSNGASDVETSVAESLPSRAPQPSNGRHRASDKSATTESAGSGLSEKLVDEVEAGIDDLMFKIKLNGGMPEVEEALRSARRMMTRGNGV